ncbi:MAG: gliding motility-associated C-terminal domain-containing protein [Bacteroidota bacterium]|nr:gliding motility-associated C-terminal domain-containing protein [Bacteroidota bacterium]
MKTIYFFLTLILTLVCGSLKSQNCTVNGGIDQSNCVTLPGELKGNASGLFSTTAHWVLVNGPSVQITNPDSLKTAVTGYKGGNIYTFKIAATCKDGTTVADQVTIKISAIPSTPKAGSDQSMCTINGLKVDLAASSLDSGEIGLWKVISGGSGTFSDATSPDSKFTLSGNNCIGITDVVLRWTVTNGDCNAYDEVTISYTGGASVDAGLHQNVSCATKARLAGSCPGAGKQTGTWTLLSGPGGGTFGNKNTYNTTLGDLVIGTYYLKWTVSGPCVSNEDTVSITILSLGITSTIAASPNQSYCIGNLPSSFAIQGTAADSSQSGLWTQTAGTATKIANKDTASTSITGITAAGAYTYKWAISKGLCATTAMVTITVLSKLSADAGPDIVAICGASTATMTPVIKGGSWTFVSGPSVPAISGNNITKLFKKGVYKLRYVCSNTCGKAEDTALVTISSIPTNAKAGTDQIFACNVVSGTLAANSPSSGAGTWTQISGPNTAKIADIHNPSSGLTGLIGGRYYITWNIDGGAGCATNTDEVVIYVSTDAPTAANAGDDQTITKNTTLILKGNTPKGAEIGTWSQIGGTPVTIDSTNLETTHITGVSENSTYTFVWTISNSCGSTADTLIVNIIPDSKVGKDASYCNATIINIYGNNPGAGKGVWSQETGPQCTITDINNQTTSIKNMSPGIYQFKWTITIGGGSSNSIITITNYAPVSANAGSHQYININKTPIATLNGNFVSPATGIWSMISGNAVTIENPASPNSRVSGLTKGDYTFRWTVTNGLCSSYSDVRISVSDTKTNTNPPDSHIVVQYTDPKVYVPNAFTPNDDGLNEYFKPTTNGVEKYTMVLYNRWGQQIYVGNENDPGWNGTLKEKECPQDVYMYEIVYEGKSSSDFVVGETIRGTITLMR